MQEMITDKGRVDTASRGGRKKLGESEKGIEK